MSLLVATSLLLSTAAFTPPQPMPRRAVLGAAAAAAFSSSHVLPRMQEHHTTLHRTAHGWIEGYVPKEYAPLTAAIVSYVLLVLPFCAAYAVFKAMDALLSIQKLLLAINVYNACYCALLVVINLWTGNEPMASLQESNEADYLILQFFKVRLFYFIFVWEITCRLTCFFFNHSSARRTALSSSFRWCTCACCGAPGRRT